MITELRPIETRDQALHRLARLARKRGIRILTYPLTGEQFALSLSHPEAVHRVTRLGCDCLGFTYHNRCTHYAALLEMLGELSPEPAEKSVSADRAMSPVVVCDKCDEIMTHVNGVSFACSCGERYAVGWQTAEEIDRAVARLSLHDPDRFAAILDLLSDEDESEVGVRRTASRADAPATLGLYHVSANDIAAVLVWRADLDDRNELDPAA
jgi:hypothetical protein